MNLKQVSYNTQFNVVGAWHEVYRRLTTGPVTGICDHVRGLLHEARISSLTHDFMMRRLSSSRPAIGVNGAIGGLWWWPLHEQGRMHRLHHVLGIIALAEQAEKALAAAAMTPTRATFRLQDVSTVDIEKELKSRAISNATHAGRRARESGDFGEEVVIATHAASLVILDHFKRFPNHTVAFVSLTGKIGVAQPQWLKLIPYIGE